MPTGVDSLERSAAATAQALVRVAIVTYVETGEIPDVSEAVHRLLHTDIEPRMDDSIFAEPNAFRDKFTYFEEADAVLRQHEASLRPRASKVLAHGWVANMVQGDDAMGGGPLQVQASKINENQ